MSKIYCVDLSDEERTALLDLIKKGKPSARKVTRARILLLAHDGKTDAHIAAALQTGLSTVERTRRKFVAGSLPKALNERPRPGAQRKLKGKQEAFLVALTCSTPPEGHTRWTMQLLADQLVALEIMDDISDETVRRTLKKTNSSPG